MWLQPSVTGVLVKRAILESKNTPSEKEMGLGQILPPSLRGNQLCLHLDLRLLVSRMRDIFLKPLHL